ncbi:hypothetical protein Trydic_g12678 [Trypoxylus dichotomus]
METTEKKRLISEEEKIKIEETGRQKRMKDGRTDTLRTSNVSRRQHREIEDILRTYVTEPTGLNRYTATEIRGSVLKYTNWT